MFETMAGGENPRPGGQSKTLGSSESTELAPSVSSGVETALGSIAANKAGKWYWGVLEAAERVMVRWHEVESELSRQRHASAVGGVQGDGGRGGNRRRGRKPDQGNAGKGGGRSRRETAVDEKWKDIYGRQGSKAPGRVGRRTCLCYSDGPQGALWPLRFVVVLVC